MAWKHIFHSYTLDNLLLQPFPPLPPLSPLAPIVVSFLPLLSSLRGISELFPHEKTFPRAKTAITAASSHPRPARHPRPSSGVARPPGDGRHRGMVVPRPLSVEQIAAPSPKERRDRRSPSLFQIVTAERSHQFCPPHSTTDSRIPGRLARVAVADSERLRALFRTRFTIETSRASLAVRRPSRL